MQIMWTQIKVIKTQSKPRTQSEFTLLTPWPALRRGVLKPSLPLLGSEMKKSTFSFHSLYRQASEGGKASYSWIFPNERCREALLTSVIKNPVIYFRIYGGLVHLATDPSVVSSSSMSLASFINLSSSGSRVSST